jgi:ATP-binding cassette, subfamily B, bacterial PglK
MIDIFHKVGALMSARSRQRAKLVFLLMLSLALMETAGVASIMPFVAVLSKPEVVETNAYLAAVYRQLGFISTNSFMFFLGLVVLALFLCSLGLQAMTNYAIVRFSSMQSHTIGSRLLGAYLRQPYTFFLARNTADLSKSVLSEANQVTGGVMIPLMKIISGTVVAAAIFSLLMFVDPLISIVIVALLGGSYATVYFFASRFLNRIGEDRIRANRERYILASEALNGIKELRLMGREQAYLQRFRDPSERFARHQATSNIIGGLPSYGIQAVAFGGMLVILLYLIGRQGGLGDALPIFALYIFAGSRLKPSIQEIFGNLIKLRFSLPALESLYNDLMYEEAQADQMYKRAPSPPLLLRKFIRLENVTYRYPTSSIYALKGITLTIPVGSCVGFIGKTGAGKSTTVDLILGLLTPTSGQVVVDGHPLKPARLRAWQDNFGYVPQSTYLADDTVAANIAFGLPAESIDQDAVERVAHTAHIHDFIISELPKGYKTMVGERGIRLSGGQRQRLAIARALYHALDNATEAAVMEAIETLHGLKTIILIANRLSTVRKCDLIFLLDHGQLAGEGTFDGLARSNTEFRRLAHGSGL